MNNVDILNSILNEASGSFLSRAKARLADLFKDEPEGIITPRDSNLNTDTADIEKQYVQGQRDYGKTKSGNTSDANKHANARELPKIDAETYKGNMPSQYDPPSGVSMVDWQKKYEKPEISQHKDKSDAELQKQLLTRLFSKEIADYNDNIESSGGKLKHSYMPADHFEKSAVERRVKTMHPVSDQELLFSLGDTNKFGKDGETFASDKKTVANQVKDKIARIPAAHADLIKAQTPLLKRDLINRTKDSNIFLLKRQADNTKLPSMQKRKLSRANYSDMFNSSRTASPEELPNLAISPSVQVHDVEKDYIKNKIENPNVDNNDPLNAYMSKYDVNFVKNNNNSAKIAPKVSKLPQSNFLQNLKTGQKPIPKKKEELDPDFFKTEGIIQRNTEVKPMARNILSETEILKSNLLKSYKLFENEKTTCSYDLEYEDDPTIEKDYLGRPIKKEAEQEEDLLMNPEIKGKPTAKIKGKKVLIDREHI